jgi:hypothetical protein
MCKTTTLINIINISFSVINLIFAIILQVQKGMFNSKTETTLVRYRYFENVLVEPYFKLIITSFFYDILLYTTTFLLTKYFFKVSSDKNEENIRTKSIQENMVSNLMVEFLFMIMIKGLALGFGIFYIYEIDEEIKRIIKVRDINEDQEAVLNSMISFVIINGVLNFITIVYQFFYFGIRLWIACKNNKKGHVQENMIMDDRKKFNKINTIKKEKHLVSSFGNISLPETKEEINYEKLDQ